MALEPETRLVRSNIANTSASQTVLEEFLEQHQHLCTHSRTSSNLLLLSHSSQPSLIDAELALSHYSQLLLTLLLASACVRSLYGDVSAALVLITYTTKTLNLVGILRYLLESAPALVHHLHALRSYLRFGDMALVSSTEPIVPVSTEPVQTEPVTKPKILLFGRTGSGKSTVANMLIKGHLAPTLLFPTSSGVRGRTLTFQREENNDWVVVDTVGLGEGQHGSILDAEARNKLYDFFVKISQESYNYYAFVQRWGKLDELDERLWNFFKQAFEGAERNFVIIFTHCSSKALEDNLEDIKVAFQGCERYITVDFPAIDKPETSASAKARRNEKLREISFKKLQESLGRYMQPPIRLCLRSNLKNGRILLIGTATRARNVVAKLLVEGSVNTTSMAGVDGMALDGIGIGGNDENRSTVLEELEGRRWQVVNALAFDSASICDVYDGSLNKEEAVIAASKLLASNFLTILEHGLYSHLVYVAESGEMPPSSKIFLQEILKAIKWKSFKTIAVIVSYDANFKVEPKKASKLFKELTTICQIQLPKYCDPTETDNEVIERHALVALEETIFRSTPYLFWRPLHGWRPFHGLFRENWNGGPLEKGTFENNLDFIYSIANPTAFKEHVYAYVEELHGIPGVSEMEREFMDNLSSGDTVILWMYPHPNSVGSHENKFEIDLHFRDIGH
ncbi:hypothetical protein KC19_11G041800 [Ceratodon purpureus]|uniref:G domain-containing protein n=1 Tax=Ceratodon purpureus TaxID=3225 RepID=A0A8T0GDW4_CERPU|nr:hypothetical protein KC19_11G041800 [Ceratodon purpureus]